MLKNLRSIFIVEEEAPAKSKASSPAPNTPSSKEQAPRPVSKAPETNRDGKVTQKFTDILLSAMDNADLEGFDYLEYKKSLQSLQKMNMEERTAYQSAFAMAQTMGATPQHLVSTAQHYLKALQEEEQKFEKALSHQQESRIGAKRQEQQTLTKTIQDKEAQIKKLQAEILEHQQNLGKLDGDIKQADLSIANTKNDFFASYQNLVKQIQEDITKMQEYLK
jgi:predicted  nucleic acid-binding Zn-ribbon protein